jgi:hypothetical protein
MKLQMTMYSIVFRLIFFIALFTSSHSYSQQKVDRWSVGLSPIYGITSGTIKNEVFPFGFAQNSLGLDLRTQFQLKNQWGLGLGFSYQAMGYDANKVAEYFLHSDLRASSVEVKTKGFSIYSLAPFIYYKWQSTYGFFIKVHAGAGVAIIQSPHMEALVYTQPYSEFHLSRGITNTIVYNLGIQPGYQVNSNLSVLLSVQGAMSSPNFKWQNELGLERSQKLAFKQIIFGLGIEYRLCTQKKNGKF